ncbi:MAG: hypothetical protein FJ295_02780 [Planctomycetes bacterium]|nr:hypothetical protein [Planctomycetota bacterium]
MACIVEILTYGCGLPGEFPVFPQFDQGATMRSTLKIPRQLRQGKFLEYAIFAALMAGAMYVGAGFVGLL